MTFIVVSYDAFRNEYFDRGVTNFTNQLRFNSTSAKYMRNIFTTKTYPNHNSIATGVYSDDHGVTANEFYDSDLKKAFKYSFEMFHYRSEIKPIWILNEEANGNSGCMMWPGSDYFYDGVSCKHKQHYNLSENFHDRVDQVMSWILDKKYPANLVMFYIEEPDTHAHAFGPESKEITELVRKLDETTEYLYSKIVENNLENRVNVIHLSDHGMSELQLKNVIDLRKIVNNNVSYYGSTPVLQIVPDILEETDSIYEKLLNASKELKTFKVYLNRDLPERWHYNNEFRVGPLTVVAEINYGFQDMFDAAEYYKIAYNISVTNEHKYGVHGYDNEIELMHPIFFAYGHLIKNFNQIEPFDSVDLLYLFCDILGINPPKYLKGNRENILPILKSNETQRMSRWVVLGKFLTFFVKHLIPYIFVFLFQVSSIILSSILVTTFMISKKLWRRNRSNVPSYLYEEDTTVLDDTKLQGSINQTTPTQSTSLATSSSTFNAF